MSLMYRIAAEGGVRDVDETKREVLVSFPWEVIDSYNTDFARDAFDEHLQQALPVMCWQHQRSEPIGRAKHWEKTATANELVAGFSDFDAVPRARQAFVQLRDGELTDFSYGFDRGKTVTHPAVRGAVRFSSARMAEISPVTVGSIPGATGTIRGAVGLAIRAEAEVANVRGLVDAGAISQDDAERMLREAGVDRPRERIEVATRTDVLADAIRDAFADGGARAVTLSVADSGAVTISQDATVSAPVDAAVENLAAADDDQDVNDLASAIDAACDAADVLLEGVDVSGLPAQVQQALALYSAASVAADELLDTLGVPDPDDTDDTDGDEQRAVAEDVPAASDVAEPAVDADSRAAEDLTLAFEAAQAQLTAALNAGRR